ncbi:MAG: hypothetical protein FWG63_06665 [Defluviitaleaceae bacterium]|nr:hypothetical protein [Defluviitaleaceae bacterium]
MDAYLHSNFVEISETELTLIEGGNFFGVVSGVAQTIHGCAAIALGVLTMKVPGGQLKAANAFAYGGAHIMQGISNINANLRW